MKTLKTLIKLAKQDLDEKRQELNVFLDKKDELLKQRSDLDKRLAEEQEFATDSEEFKYAYTAFSAKIAWQQENIDNFTKALDEQIDFVSEKISEGFAELKRYEIMLDKKMRDEQKELQRKETIEMDEIGMVAHGRKEENA